MGLGSKLASEGTEYAAAYTVSMGNMERALFPGGAACSDFKSFNSTVRED